MENKKDAKAQRLKNLRLKSRGRGRRGGHGAELSGVPHGSSEDETEDEARAAGSNARDSRKMSRGRGNLGSNWDRYEDSEEEAGPQDRDGGESVKVASVKDSYTGGRPKSKGADYAALLDEGLADPLAFVNNTSSVNLRPEDWEDLSDLPLLPSSGDELKMLSVDLEALNILLSELPLARRLWLHGDNGVGGRDDANEDADLCRYIEDGTASTLSIQDEGRGIDKDVELYSTLPRSWAWHWSAEEGEVRHDGRGDPVSSVRTTKSEPIEGHLGISSKDMAYDRAKDVDVAYACAEDAGLEPRAPPLSESGSDGAATVATSSRSGILNVAGAGPGSGGLGFEEMGEVGLPELARNVLHGAEGGMGRERGIEGVGGGLAEENDELDALLGALDRPPTTSSGPRGEVGTHGGVTRQLGLANSWDESKAKLDMGKSNQALDKSSFSKPADRRAVVDPSRAQGHPFEGKDREGISEGRGEVKPSLVGGSDDVDLDFDAFMDTLK